MKDYLYYSFGTYYEAWGLFNQQKIYTWSPENIPGPLHCTCLPTSTASYLPEFCSLKNASLESKNTTIPGHLERVDKWVVNNEILSKDTYSVWVMANTTKGRTAIPVRTLWVDPGPDRADDIIERSDYKFVQIGDNFSESEFKPNESCLKASC